MSFICSGACPVYWLSATNIGMRRVRVYVIIPATPGYKMTSIYKYDTTKTKAKKKHSEELMECIVIEGTYSSKKDLQSNSPEWAT
jgi:hypothetical protein